MKPRYTITLTDNRLGKEMTIGSDEYDEFKKKAISGKTRIYEFLDNFEEQVLGKTSSSPTK